MDFERHAPKARPINLTPLIDVVFLLVVFFMLSTSFAINETMEITLPEIGAKAAGGKDTTTRIYVDEGGVIYWDGTTKAEPDPQARLKDMFAANPDTKVLLLGSKRVSVQEFVGVMDMIYLAGGKQLALADWEDKVEYMPVIQIKSDEDGADGQ